MEFNKYLISKDEEIIAEVNGTLEEANKVLLENMRDVGQLNVKGRYRLLLVERTLIKK